MFMNSDFASVSTEDLIKRLFKDEDQADIEIIRELTGRGEEAAVPLREIVANEDYWYEGKFGDFWIVVHAIIILSAMRDEKALPILIEMVPHAYFANHDFATEIYPLALSEYGESAVEPFIKFILDHRGSWRDNPDYSYCRYTFSIALTRMALKNENLKPRVLDFLCQLLREPQEDDQVFISFILSHLLALDRKKVLPAIEAAYGRNVVDETICGSYDEFIGIIKEKRSSAFRDLDGSIFDFYHPEVKIQRRKDQENIENEKLYWHPEDMAIPAGYSVTESGNAINTGKVGRNDPCPCGSGKKYKKCCGS